MAKTYVGEAHGKVILSGEHAVVYGYPALAFAVSPRTRVELTPASDVVVDAPIDNALLRDALSTALGDRTAHVRIRTDLPIGRGMGSSAALSTALVRAIAAWDRQTPSKEAVFRGAMQLETIFHARPSGIDVAVAVDGGMLRFVRDPEVRFETVSVPTEWAAVALDSGVAGSTKAMVESVAARRDALAPVLQRIGTLTERAEQCLGDPEALGEVLDAQHAALSELGVSTAALDTLVAFAKGHGSLGAKLSGAGGGGIVLAITREPDRILRAAQRDGIAAILVRTLEDA